MTDSNPCAVRDARMELLGVSVEGAVRARYYENDPFFREAATIAAASATGNFETLGSMLRKFTLIVFKPDAAAGDAVAPGLAFLRAHGLMPVTGRLIRFTPAMIRSLWRYQFNRTSPERLLVTDALLCSGPSLAVLLRSARNDDLAAQRLAALKGSADSSGPTDGSLRGLLGRRNAILNMVHTPDDPASFLRDALICLGSRDYRRWLDLMAQPSMATDALPSLPRPAGGLDFETAVAELRAFAIEGPQRRAYEALTRGELPYEALAGLLRATRDDMAARWHATIAASYLVPLNRPGVDKLI